MEYWNILFLVFTIILQLLHPRLGHWSLSALTLLHLSSPRLEIPLGFCNQWLEGTGNVSQLQPPPGSVWVWHKLSDSPDFYFLRNRDKTVSKLFPHLCSELRSPQTTQKLLPLQLLPTGITEKHLLKLLPQRLFPAEALVPLNIYSTIKLRLLFQLSTVHPGSLHPKEGGGVGAEHMEDPDASHCETS